MSSKFHMQKIKSKISSATSQADQRHCFFLMILNISISNLYHVAEGSGLCLSWSETPRTEFVATLLICIDVSGVILAPVI